MGFYYYTFEDGCYHLKDGEEILTSHSQVAICFEASTSVLLKHGSPENVLKKTKEMKQQYKEHDLNDIANDIEVLILPVGFPVEEINKCLGICNYIGILARKVKTNQID